MALLRRYGDRRHADAGEKLYTAGDRAYDFIVLDTASVEIIREATADRRAAVVARHGPRRFLGELSLLTGQSPYLTAHVVQGGEITTIASASFRRLMDEEPDLSDVILRAFLARREILRAGEGARSVQVLGSGLSAASLALRTWASRAQIAHTWQDIDAPGGAELARALKVRPDALPVVVTPAGVLEHATPGMLAAALGMAYTESADAPSDTSDVVIVGAGPAGLAAAVYGASEGLRTLVVDAVAAGGQAAASSRIENYLGFTSGISGAELTGRAVVQAQKFGARVTSPCEVTGLRRRDGHFEMTLADGTPVPGRAIVVASGARYRKLALPRWAEFEGSGIFYAATEIEARSCARRYVAVVGGANSAGQAALYLAQRASGVTLVVRAADLSAGMSSYLAERIMAEPRIDVRTSSEVVALHGGEHLECLTLADRRSTTSDVPCSGLFCFIGADPATSWLSGVLLDDRGFVLTDSMLRPQNLSSTWRRLGRRPLPFETSEPGIFAVGDVRGGSMKRVAAAVGEGASCIRSVHTFLGDSGT